MRRTLCFEIELLRRVGGDYCQLLLEGGHVAARRSGGFGTALKHPSLMLVRETSIFFEVILVAKKKFDGGRSDVRYPRWSRDDRLSTSLGSQNAL